MSTENRSAAGRRLLKAVQSLSGGVLFGYGLSLFTAGIVNSTALVALLMGLLGVLEGVFPR